MHRRRALVANDSAEPIEVALEQWGRLLELLPGHSFEIVGESGGPGGFEIQRASDVFVYAWPGSTLRVSRDGELVHEERQAVAEVPRGTAVAGFMDDVTGL